MRCENTLLAVACTVLLSVPTALLGAVIALMIGKMDNNVYAQVGIVLLIGLCTKTAILIVEFAKVQREEGKSVFDAAMEAADLRFRIPDREIAVQLGSDHLRLKIDGDLGSLFPEKVIVIQIAPAVDHAFYLFAKAYPSSVDEGVVGLHVTAIVRQPPHNEISHWLLGWRRRRRGRLCR